MKRSTKSLTKLIPLTQGKFAIIDAKDFDLVNQYKWYYRKSGKTNGKNGYAQHSFYVPNSFNKNRGYREHISLFMHNLILRPKKGFVIDHINHNGLDNRRSNLRRVTVRQNYANFPLRKNKSGYRGVTYHARLKNSKPYEARIRVDNVQLSLGTFLTANEAAEIYNKAAKKYFGKCAQLNEI